MQLTDIGITPRKASQFAAKGICSVQDLLMIYPTKYLDFRNPISLADGKQYAGQHVAVRGQVVSSRVVTGKHFMLRLSDGNNFCSVFWFNQSYRASQFSVGQMLAVGGVASWSDEYKSLTISAPDFVSCDLQTAFCIKPIYRKIKGMSDEYLLDAIALATSGAVGSDLANMINEAAILAVKNGRKAVSQKDLYEAVEVVLVGKEKKDRILSQEERRIVAYHEVGHALVSALQKDAEPVQKITIVPRTMGALGYVMQVPEEEKYLNTKAELEAMLVGLLGGRAAEEVVFGNVTTGASNDIEKATQIAKAMITQYGMSE